MKKNFLAIILATLLLLAIFAGCADKADNSAAANETDNTQSETNDNKDASETDEPAEDGLGLKIGMIMSDYTNAVWAEVAETAKSYAASEYGSEVTAVAFNADNATAVNQIENFVASQYDAIIISPNDSDALSAACQEAMDAGVHIVTYGATLNPQSCEYNVAEYDSGFAAGTACADWIEGNEALKDVEEIQIGIINYRKTPQTIGREDGFEAAVTERVPNAKIVVRSEGLTNEEGYNAAESFFTAYPELNVIYSIGGSGALGANEAAIAAGFASDTFAIFCCDCTQESAQALKDGDPLRACISLGGGKAHGMDMVDICVDLCTGKEVEPVVYLPIEEVTIDNLEEFCQENGYVLQ